MGKQKGVYLNGKSSNVLYYCWKTIPCQRMIPQDVHQSPEVISQQKFISLSTKMGASFRKQLTDVLPYPKSMEMQTALRIALLKWLKQGPFLSEASALIPCISGLSFNEAASLNRCIQHPIVVTSSAVNGLSVFISEMVPTDVITAPEATSIVHLKISAACCNTVTGEELEHTKSLICIPYNNINLPAQKILLPLNMPENSLTMVVAAIDYFAISGGKMTLILNRHFRPSQVISSVIR